MQCRATRKDGLTKAKRAIFLEALMATCNVTQAAQKAGISANSARRLKQRDGEFAMLWADAFASGSERLEEMLMAQALGQASSGDNPDQERAEPEPRAFDAKLALEVLRLRGSDKPAHRRRKSLCYATQAEVDAALAKRLDALAKRLKKP